MAMLLALAPDVAASPIANKDVSSPVANIDGLIQSQSRVAGRDPLLSTAVDGLRLDMSATEVELRRAIPDAAVLEFQPRAWTGTPADDDPAALAENSRSGGETLRQTLRALATMHHADLRSLDQSQPEADRYRSGRSQAPRSRDEGNDEAGSAGFSATVIDGDVAANAVRALVEIKSTDALSTTFSVLGLGDFVLEATPGSNTVTLTELSSGFSASLPVNSSGINGSYGTNQNARESEEASGSVRANVNHFRVVLKWIVEFLESPLGILLTMLVSVMSLLWVMVRTFALLGRMTSRAHLR
jgi:hypothetical protein